MNNKMTVPSKATASPLPCQRAGLLWPGEMRGCLDEGRGKARVTYRV